MSKINHKNLHAELAYMEPAYITLYKTAIYVLERKTQNLIVDKNPIVDKKIIELACQLYYENKSKESNLAYIKLVVKDAHKILYILHIIECLVNEYHPVIPVYKEYVDATRLAKNMHNF